MSILNPPTPLESLTYKLRIAVCDDGGLMVRAADEIDRLTRELDAALQPRT